MKIFLNKEIKLLFMVLGVFSLLLIALGILAARMAADDYKQKMIAHDYQIAGYLTQNGVEKSLVIRAFTAEKSNEDAETGQKLLQKTGYSGTVQNDLLPDIERFYQKHAAIVLIILIMFSIITGAVVLLFVLRHYKRIEEAELRLRDFMAGNIGIRLDDYQEGSLSKLFAAVNLMATSQVAHIEKEKQGREFLKDTISDISHQIKTPLAALRMYNEIIQNEKTGNSVVDNYSLKIEREISRIESLILNLLKLARLDAGSIQLEISEQNIKEFLEEVVRGFSTRAKVEGKELTLNCDDHIAMNFDPEWLMEAIGNIIKNALDHTGSQNKIEVCCSETPLSIQITIKDNGTGIHPEDMHHIFKRFYRSRFSKEKQGIGIGLALSKSIIEKHGGTITVQSELGKGAAFNLFFPKLSKL
ncbi:MAG: sensor histidine kinase [Dethiobacteria bacterium]|jgi:signal transduction histidine kinase